MIVTRVLVRGTVKKNDLWKPGWILIQPGRLGSVYREVISPRGPSFKVLPVFVGDDQPEQIKVNALSRMFLVWQNAPLCR